MNIHNTGTPYEVSHVLKECKFVLAEGLAWLEFERNEKSITWREYESRTVTRARASTRLSFKEQAITKTWEVDLGLFFLNPSPFYIIGTTPPSLVKKSLVIY